MFNRSFRIAAFALAALVTGTHAAHAAEGLPLERWRSYAGVSWAASEGGADPAPFAGSVGAPIAGIHFDAQGQAYVLSLIHI